MASDIEPGVGAPTPPKATPNGAGHPEPLTQTAAAAAPEAVPSADDKPSTVRRTVRKASKPKPSAPAGGRASAAPKPKTAATKDDAASPTAASASYMLCNFTDFVERARERYENLDSEFSSSAEAVREGADEASEAMRNASEAARDGARELSNQLAEITQAEVTEALDLANGMVKCKSMSELLELQSDFTTKVLERRMEQLRDFNAASMDAAMRTFQPWSGGFSAFFAKAGDMARTGRK